MSISEFLVSEFDQEIMKTRTALERVPADQKDFVPHEKSMPLGRLASHLAELPGFGFSILTTPEVDFGKGEYKPLAFESPAELESALEEGAAKVREALQNMNDETWGGEWKLSYKGKPIFQGSRFLAYRQMFLNHLVHHRAQLGVYLRLTGKAVPLTYGPSADTSWGSDLFSEPAKCLVLSQRFQPQESRGMSQLFFNS
jgi:uncharacterized damage-inducible protein DinB